MNNNKKATGDKVSEDMFCSPTLVKQRLVNEYTMYLDKPIFELSQLMEHLEIFNSAQLDDVIFLHINSLGGSVSVGQVYINHMRQCEAKIVGIVGMDCASEAAAIATQCDDLIFDEMSTMLIHQFSYGNMPTTANDIYRTAKFNKELNKRWVDTYFSELLTDEEYERLMSDQDVLLNSDQLQERWGKIVEKRTEQMRLMIEDFEQSLSVTHES